MEEACSSVGSDDKDQVFHLRQLCEVYNRAIEDPLATGAVLVVVPTLHVIPKRHKNCTVPPSTMTVGLSLPQNIAVYSKEVRIDKRVMTMYVQVLIAFLLPLCSFDISCYIGWL